MPIIPDKQARKVAIPIAPIVDLLARKGLVVSPLLREARADVRQGIIILHLETDVPAGVSAQPYEVQMDWASLFDSA
jgi:hypothetical protein